MIITNNCSTKKVCKIKIAEGSFSNNLFSLLFSWYIYCLVMMTFGRYFEPSTHYAAKVKLEIFEVYSNVRAVLNKTSSKALVAIV